MAELSENRKFPVISGWLFKWTNYLRGYQKRWFVLSNGYLCYYRNQEEMEHTCRGALSLSGATIYSEESNNFIVSNGETYHIKASSDLEKKKWVDALTSARAIASTQGLPSSSADSLVTAMASNLKQKLEEVKNCNFLINRHGNELDRSLSEMERLISTDDTNPIKKEISEKAEIFRASTSSMIKACSDYLDLAECHYDKWVTLVEKKTSRKMLTRQIVDSMINSICLNNNISKECHSDEESSEYFDCEEAASAVDHLRSPADKTSIQVYAAVASSNKGKEGSSQNIPRRSRVPDRPKVSANLWSIIKNAVGKDLTKIPVPVNFSEPLSLLQRLTEDFEYAHKTLDEASSSGDPGEQMAYVAGFAVSSYSTTISRSGKPFNPLLGETYECDRTSDFGWKSIAEQVSHHPPIAALHCESKNWVCWQEQSMHTKFRGQYLQIFPLGEVHLKFKNGNVHYVWKKAITNIHNIIIGKLWIDQEGDVEIKCYTNGYSCRLTFLAPGYFSGEPYRIKGLVRNKEGKPVLEVNGGYDSKLELSLVKETIKQSKVSTNLNTKVIWERDMPAMDSDRYYNFTVFACQLNEMEPGVAPTDTRNRPDQRLMEEGQFDKANDKKQELEDIQREKRKKRQEAAAKPKNEDSEEFWRPTWFAMEKDADTSTEMYVYKGEYWQCKEKNDWSRCPQIF